MQSGLKNTTISNKKAKLSFKKKIYIYIYIFIYLRNQVEFLKIETKSEFIPYYFLVQIPHFKNFFFFFLLRTLSVRTSFDLNPKKGWAQVQKARTMNL